MSNWDLPPAKRKANERQPKGKNCLSGPLPTWPRQRLSKFVWKSSPAKRKANERQTKGKNCLSGPLPRWRLWIRMVLIMTEQGKVDEKRSPSTDPKTATSFIDYTAYSCGYQYAFHLLCDWLKCHASCTKKSKLSRHERLNERIQTANVLIIVVFICIEFNGLFHVVVWNGLYRSSMNPN